MSEINLQVGIRLKQVRSALAFKQGEFADQLEIAQSYLSELEGGKKEVPTKILTILFNRFKVSANWLLFGEGDMFLEKSKSQVSSDEHLIKNANRLREIERWKDRILKELQIIEASPVKSLNKASLISERIIDSDPELNSALYGLFSVERYSVALLDYYDVYIGRYISTIEEMVEEALENKTLDKDFINRLLKTVEPVRKYAPASEELKKYLIQTVNELQEFDDQGILKNYLDL